MRGRYLLPDSAAAPPGGMKEGGQGREDGGLEKFCAACD